MPPPPSSVVGAKDGALDVVVGAGDTDGAVEIDGATEGIEDTDGASVVDGAAEGAKEILGAAEVAFLAVEGA